MKLFLNMKLLKARQDFYKENQNWTKEDWERLNFSDENKICLHGSDGRQYTWSKPNEMLKQKHVRRTIKHDPCLMVWGYFSSNDVGNITIIEDTLTSDKYVKILSTHIKPSANRLIGRDYVFQHDNDPKHRKDWKNKIFQYFF